MNMTSASRIQKPTPSTPNKQLYEEDNYVADNSKNVDVSVLNDTDEGVALRAVKDKWNELGPLKLEEIMESSDIEIN